MGENRCTAPKIETVGLAGLGHLGCGVAACFLGHGYRLVAYDPLPSARQHAREYIALALRELVERAGFPASLHDTWPSRYTEAASLNDFAACQFFVESIIEDEAAKKKLFTQIEAVLPADAPVASNTSAIPISRLQEGCTHPERFLGMHWFQPAYVTRFLEVIRGAQTSDAVFAQAEALAWSLDKEPALGRKDIRGFVANRLGYAMFREALYLIDQGVADAETIDRTVRNASGWVAAISGPCRIMDRSGLPLFAAVMHDLFPELSNATEIPASMRALLDSGAHGMASGRGFHEYQPGDLERWDKKFKEFAWEMRALTEKYAPLKKP